jgi:hypothetical protein
MLMTSARRAATLAGMGLSLALDIAVVVVVALAATACADLVFRTLGIH